MGLIGKNVKGKVQQQSGATIVAAGTKLRGELTLESALHIDGTVEGTIESTSDVSVGHGGSFDGNVKARQVVVSGYVHGKIDCDRLEIVAQGKVYGEVTSQEFVIEPGGQFVGESHVRGNQPVPALDHRPQTKTPAKGDATLAEA